MSQKALGRDLGDLLSRARPARLVDRAAIPGGSKPASEPAAVPPAEPALADRPSIPPVRDLHSEPGTTATQPKPPTMAPPEEGPRTRWTSAVWGFVGTDVACLAGAVWARSFAGFPDTMALGVSLGLVAVGCGAGIAAALLHAFPSPPVERPESRIRVQLKH